MKKLFLLLLMAVTLVACDNRKPATEHTEDVSTASCTLCEFTVRGVTHEYILYSTGPYGGISGVVHLPECQYCKNTEN